MKLTKDDIILIMSSLEKYQNYHYAQYYNDFIDSRHLKVVSDEVNKLKNKLTNEFERIEEEENI